MRILSITPELPSLQRPGSMAPTARQIESLRALGIESTTIDMRGPAKVKYLQAIPRVRRLARECDLVHAHFGYCGWLAKMQLGKPIVLSLMGSDVYGDALENGRPSRASALVAWLNRTHLAPRVAHVIVKSPRMAELVSPVLTTVIANGVDTELFRPLAQHKACENLGWPSDVRRVLFPGNPANPRKGHALATAAVEIAARQIGEPIELVNMWGVAPSDVPLYMNACDCMLMASFAEGSPNVVKEALACGSRIVSSPVGDVGQLLEQVAGCRVCPRSEAAFGEALAELLTSPIASAGRVRIAALGLDLPSVARRVCQVYEKVLGKPVLDEPAAPTRQPAFHYST